MLITTNKQNSGLRLRSVVQKLWGQAPPEEAPPQEAPMLGDKQRLTAYRTSGPYGQTIMAAPPTRPWMDASPDRFAYRCLPMLIANQSGWLILNDISFEAKWNGESADDGVKIAFLDDGLDLEPETQASLEACVVSHFGCGIITWTLPYLFQTPPGWSLLARGPANWPFDGVSPLEGIVETDQAASTFTMNWKITRPDFTVRFDRGDPICMIVPQQRGELESFEPKFHSIEGSGPLLQRYLAWQKSRTSFLKKIEKGDRDAVGRGWQKNYFRGEDVDKTRFQEHVTRIPLQEFVETEVQ